MSQASMPTAVSKGVTLPELLVVMAILAIALTSISPSLFGVMDDSRVASDTNTLLHDIKLARQEAVVRGYRVVVCAIKDKDTSTCDDSRDWSTGWMVFADADLTLKPTNQAQDLIRVQDPLPPAVKITSAIGGAGNLLIYNPDGSTSYNGHFDITSTNTSSLVHARKITWDTFSVPRIDVSN